MAGRRPLPTKRKELQGTMRADRRNGEEPQPEVKIPKTPDGLTGEAKAEWDRLTPQLKQLGLLSDIDRTALLYYCQYHARYYDAMQKIEEEGLVIEHETRGTCANPYVKISNDAASMVHKFLVEFGMTPSSRSRVKVGKKEEQKEGRIAKLLQIK